MEQTKQQTAVDSLWDSLACLFFFQDGIPVEAMERYNQAKQMEEEQIKTAYNKGYQDGEIDSLDAKDGDVQFFEDAEQYYNETYNTN
jgi:Zn/Cd-binding protein ZinT